MSKIWSKNGAFRRNHDHNKTVDQVHHDIVPETYNRPVCANCGKPRDVMVHERDSAGIAVKWYYKGYGHFCTLRCASRYANRIVEQTFTAGWTMNKDI